jgi:hypothetical protein
MPQLFRPGADTIARTVLVCILIFPFAFVGIAYAFMRSPYVTGQSVTLTQPVPFSHQHHVGGLGLDCRYCHTSVETGRFAGMPPTSTCMTCHSQLYTNTAMLAPVRESLAEHRPLHWQRVNRLPDYVYFDHSIHIAKGVGCSTCHGAVSRMPLLRQAAPLTMGWCLDCHRNPVSQIRPHSAVFDDNWTAPKDQLELGRRRLVEYHIQLEHLTDCSKCHR